MYTCVWTYNYAQFQYLNVLVLYLHMDEKEQLA